MRNKDIFRAALGSGHFPLTFNFVHRRDGRYIQCYGCGKYVYYRHITRDHVYPKSKGGILKAPACVDCNIAKENMLPIEWALYAYRKHLDMATIPIGSEFIQEEVEALPNKHELYKLLNSDFDQLINKMPV